MIVFWILWSVAMLFCIVNVVFTVHMLVSSKKMIDSVKNWAYEIDKSNFSYIRQEFAKLKYENGLVVVQDENNDNNLEKDENEELCTEALGEEE